MKSRIIGRPDEILLMEDNAGDIRPIKKSLTENKMHTTPHVVKDGVQARPSSGRKASIPMRLV